MRAADVMTSEVIMIDDDASVQEVTNLLAEHGISAVPVVDCNRRVIGMVSEGDLLHRAETGTERRRSWWLELVASTNQLAGEYVKSHSGKVKDLMTRDVADYQTGVLVLIAAEAALTHPSGMGARLDHAANDPDLQVVIEPVVDMPVDNFVRAQSAHGLAL